MSPLSSRFPSSIVRVRDTGHRSQVLSEQRVYGPSYTSFYFASRLRQWRLRAGGRRAQADDIWHSSPRITAMTPTTGAC